MPKERLLGKSYKQNSNTFATKPKIFMLKLEASQACRDVNNDT